MVKAVITQYNQKDIGLIEVPISDTYFLKMSRCIKAGKDALLRNICLELVSKYGLSRYGRVFDNPVTVLAQDSYNPIRIEILVSEEDISVSSKNIRDMFSRETFV